MYNLSMEQKTRLRSLVHNMVDDLLERVIQEILEFLQQEGIDNDEITQLMDGEVKRITQDQLQRSIKNLIRN